MSESLISTRKRRANAGSRLKSLIQAEEIINYNEDDENVELLFQEDGTDEEFSLNEESDGDESDEADGDADVDADVAEDGEATGAAGARSESPARKRLADSEEPYDSDQMFSDSSVESSEEDEEEGEKELQKQERAKKRRQQKKQKIAPIIRKPSSSSAQKVKSMVNDGVKAEALLSDTRRSSTRQSAVQNKIELVNKLKESERRKASMKPKSRKHVHILTQEERLEEAKQTEKKNIEALNQFQQQEIIKKQKRSLLMNTKKQIYDVIEYKSFVVYTGPAEEAIEIEKEIEREKKKERRGRKSDKQKRMEMEEQKRKEEEQRRLEELKKNEAVAVKEEAVENIALSQDAGAKESLDNEGEHNDEKAGSEPLKDKPIDAAKPANNTEEHVVENTETTADIADKIGELSDTVDENGNSKEQKSHTESDQIALVSKPEATEKELGDSKAITGTADQKPEIVKTDNKSSVLKEDEPVTDNAQEHVKIDAQANGDDIKDTTAEPRDAVTGEAGKPEDVEIIENTEKELPMQGPLLKRFKNYIIFKDFRNPRQINDPRAIKSMLFGEQSLLPGQKRLAKMETILHMKSEDFVSDYKSELLVPISKLKAKEFEELKKFPRLGVELVEEEEDDSKQKEVDLSKQVVINTPAPDSIYLANGQKKVCFITGKPAMYFEPKTGIPYGSVEAYKVIDKLKQGDFEWVPFLVEEREEKFEEKKKKSEKDAYSFDKLKGIYLCSRYDEHKAAKGVPEGFI